MDWGTNLERVPDFYIDEETLAVIQDFLFSGFHVLLSGNPGCGKTEFGQVWARTYGMPCHKVNSGAIRSPRDWFGCWEYQEGKGTVFVPSKFVQQIEQPGLIIIDEINRTTPDNHNPIMNILDGNREIYVDELKRRVRVHERALFLATRNTGRQFTGTFHLDHAMEDRFQKIKLQLPPLEAIVTLLRKRFPIDRMDAEKIAGNYLKTWTGSLNRAWISGEGASNNSMICRGNEPKEISGGRAGQMNIPINIQERKAASSGRVSGSGIWRIWNVCRRKRLSL